MVVVKWEFEFKYPDNLSDSEIIEMSIEDILGELQDTHCKPIIRE